MAVFTLILSFIGLLWAANHLVVGAAGIANHIRISPLIIGLTIVAFGTSTPEIVVAISAALEGHSNLAIGNAVGSNVANIGLVLGIVFLLRPQPIAPSLLLREYPLLFLIMIFTYLLMLDGFLGIIDGVLLLLGTTLLIGYFFYLSHRSTKIYMHQEFNEIIGTRYSLTHHIFSVVLGVALLPVSAHYLVESSVTIATLLGISKTIIGLTVIAIGTSLPEIATSIVAAFKEETDIAIGNILGSNMFNLITVLAFPGIINPAPIAPEILTRDIPIMFVFTLIILLMNYHYKNALSRWHGGFLLFIYCCYIGVLVS